MNRRVQYLRCGTADSLKRNERILDDYHAVPGSLYINKTGVIFVTSQEWVDWLTGKTKCVPLEDVAPVLEKDFAEILDAGNV